MSLSDEYDVRKILGVVIIVLVLISVVMYVVMLAPEEGPIVEQPIIPENQTVNATTNQTKSVYEQKLDEITAECMADKGVENEGNCIRSGLAVAAVSSLDEGYCNQINVSFLKEDCIRLSIYAQTVASESPAACDKMADTEARQKCVQDFYKGLAILKDDPSYCEFIADDETAYECNDAFFEEDLTMGENCDLLKLPYNKELCLANLARKENGTAIARGGIINDTNENGK